MTGYASRVGCTESGADMTSFASHIDMGTIESEPGTEMVERFLRIGGRLQ